MVLRVLLVGFAVGVGMMFSSRALAHPASSQDDGSGYDHRRMVIANYPIEVIEPGMGYQAMPATPAPYPATVGKRTVIANYPIETTTEYRHVSTTVLPATTVYTGPIHAASVPMPAPMPAGVPTLSVEPTTQYFIVEPQPLAVPVAAPVYAPAPKPIVITRPKPAPVVRNGLKPFDCVCARSASGKPVKVYNVASHRATVSVAKVGGGKRTVDVRGFHQGHWRVSYTPMGESGVQYGWVRQADLTCKETRAYPTRY